MISASFFITMDDIALSILTRLYKNKMADKKYLLMGQLINDLQLDEQQALKHMKHLVQLGYCDGDKSDNRGYLTVRLTLGGTNYMQSVFTAMQDETSKHVRPTVVNQ